MCAMGLEKLIRLAKVDYGFPFESSLFTDNSVYMPLIRIRDIKPAKASTYYEGEYSDRYVVRKGNILVGMDGEFNLERWNDRDGLLNQRILRIKAIDGLSDESYLYHLLAPLFKKIEKKVQGGSVKHLSAKIIENLYIPYVDFEEQVLIGKHLDTFTTLISNLESELDMRRKQYEHYRNQLLDFEGVEGVEWKTLGEVGYFYGGLSGKSKDDFQDGNAKFVTYMNIYSNSSLDTSIVDMVKVGENEKQNSINYGDILFTGSSETPDDCGMSCVVTNHVDEPIYLNSFCFGFRFNEVKKFEPSFLKHYFRCTAMRKAIAMTASGVTRFNVSKKRLGKVQMPILSINEQKEISKYLDAFENLIQSLEQEIKLRKQQYEYYREKLLTF